MRILHQWDSRGLVWNGLEAGPDYGTPSGEITTLESVGEHQADRPSATDADVEHVGRFGDQHLLVTACRIHYFQLVNAGAVARAVEPQGGDTSIRQDARGVIVGEALIDDFESTGHDIFPPDHFAVDPIFGLEYDIASGVEVRRHDLDPISGPRIIRKGYHHLEAASVNRDLADVLSAGEEEIGARGRKGRLLIPISG